MEKYGAGGNASHNRQLLYVLHIRKINDFAKFWSSALSIRVEECSKDGQDEPGDTFNQC